MMKQETVRNKDKCKTCNKQLRYEYDRYYMSTPENYHILDTYCEKCFDKEAERRKRKVKK